MKRIQDDFKLDSIEFTAEKINKNKDSNFLIYFNSIKNCSLHK